MLEIRIRKNDPKAPRNTWEIASAPIDDEIAQAYRAVARDSDMTVDLFDPSKTRVIGPGRNSYHEGRDYRPTGSSDRVKLLMECERDAAARRQAETRREREKVTATQRRMNAIFRELGLSAADRAELLDTLRG